VFFDKETVTNDAAGRRRPGDAAASATTRSPSEMVGRVAEEATARG